MKKHSFVAAWIVLIGMTVPLQAQDSKEAAPKPQPGTKVAIVNIKVVFEKYWRAQALRQELQLDMAPYREKAKKLSDEIIACEEELRTSRDDVKRMQYEDQIKKNKRHLGALSRQVSELFDKRQEADLAILWKEVNMGIDAVAKGFGFQLVLGHGEPSKVELLARSHDPKKRTIHDGKLVPLFVHSSVDITEIVIVALEPLCRLEMKKGKKSSSNKEESK